MVDFSKVSTYARPDFTVTGGGTIYLVRPENNQAREHLVEHTAEEAQWFGGALAVEHRYITDLVEALRGQGYSVAEG